MRYSGITLKIPYTPIKHSWYHYFCFSNTLIYALKHFLSFALEYIAVKESFYCIVAESEYPFVKIQYHNKPDENIQWCFFDNTEPNDIRNALRNGHPVIALRDLYDVASFNRHFGRTHHPNWYLIYGFDRHKFIALAEEGQRDETLDARCYHTLEITESEVAFIGNRVKRYFPNIYQFPLYPALTAKPHIKIHDLYKQIKEVQIKFSNRLEIGDPVDLFIEKLQGTILEVNLEAFEREEYFIRTWGMKLRAFQVLGAACPIFNAVYIPACKAMIEIDLLLASAIFWKLQFKHARASSKRLRERQLFAADCLLKIRNSEKAIAQALLKIENPLQFSD